MEFPFGHGHHHHHRRDDGEEEPPRFPPPGYGAPPPPDPSYGRDDPYGPPPVQHLSHEYGPPPPPHSSYGRDDPYGPPPVQHLSHEYGAPPPPAENFYDAPPPSNYPPSGEFGYGHHHGHRPFSSSNPVEHVRHEGLGGGELAHQSTVRVCTKAREDYSLSIRDGKVVLVPSDPRDEYQHWIKDLRYSTKVKDEEGFPSFALVNKATGEAIKHSVGATHPVRLVPYQPDYLDESVLWTESSDTGEGFRCIRMVNNIGLNFDAFHGDEDHGGVKEGTAVVLWEWLKGKNQRWKIVPY